jgi:hypothetical protein
MRVNREAWQSSKTHPLAIDALNDLPVKYGQAGLVKHPALETAQTQLDYTNQLRALMNERH